MIKGLPPAITPITKMLVSTLGTALAITAATASDRLRTHLAVEHVQPKVRRTTLRNAWSNFLLGCVHCNSSKGKKRVALRDFFWPDRDNTLRALEYVEGGLVKPHADLTAVDQVSARNTIALTGLDKFPGNLGREPTASDRRWLRRQKTWLLAKRDRDRLAKSRHRHSA